MSEKNENIIEDSFETEETQIEESTGKISQFFKTHKEKIKALGIGTALVTVGVGIGILASGGSEELEDSDDLYELESPEDEDSIIDVEVIDEETNDA